jgi:hypothetical protein
MRPSQASWQQHRPLPHHVSALEAPVLLACPNAGCDHDDPMTILGEPAAPPTGFVASRLGD